MKVKKLIICLSIFLLGFVIYYLNSRQRVVHFDDLISEFGVPTLEVRNIERKSDKLEIITVFVDEEDAIATDWRLKDDAELVWVLNNYGKSHVRTIFQPDWDFEREKFFMYSSITAFGEKILYAKVRRDGVVVESDKLRFNILIIKPFKKNLAK